MGLKSEGKSRLIAENIRKTFGKRVVVDGVTIEVATGEVVGLLGANGAGKTTSFYMIVGLERTESGRISLNGREITELPMYLRARLGLGYLPQEASVFKRLTAEENIMAVLETLPLDEEERKSRLENLLEEFRIGSVRSTSGDSLSGGERRRVEIARCLASEPEFILLDEPFAGIDPIAIDDLRQIITQLKEKGIGILITDHNVRETLGITNRAYIMADGRILKHGTPSELLGDEDVRRFYLGESFSL
jgi:lipopolysaccharide export system ATP-binding protein